MARAWLVFVLTVFVAITGRSQVGRVDTTFVASASTDGPVVCIAQQGDGKLLVGGMFAKVGGLARTGLARLNRDGTVDATFAPTLTSPQDGGVFAISVLTDGRLLVGGYFTAVNGVKRAGLVRLNAGGSVDATFAPPLQVPGAVSSLLPLASGGVVIGGLFAPDGTTALCYLLRLRDDGSIDSTFRAPNDLVSPYSAADDAPSILTLAPGRDGKIYVGGEFQLNRSYFTGTVPGSNAMVVRLNADGSPDTTFAPQQIARSVSRIVELADGSVVIAGDVFCDGTTSLPGQQGVLRLTPTGAVDRTFLPNLGVAPGVSYVSIDALLLQRNGKLLVGGNIAQANGKPVPAVIRLRRDGSLDTTFDFGASFTGSPVVLTEDASDGIYLGGQFTYADQPDRVNLVRLRAPAEAPSIVTVTADQTTSAGGNVVLSAEVYGEPSVTYRWRLNGVDIPGTDSAALGVVSAATSDAGLYTLVATNRVGSTTSTAVRLTVNPRTAGKLDASFSPPSGNNIGAVAALNDGTLLFSASSGNAVQVATDTWVYYGRLARNGSYLADYSIPGLKAIAGVGPSGAIADLRRMADGRVMVRTANRLYRLNADGSLDTTFNTPDLGQLRDAIPLHDGGFVACRVTPAPALVKVRNDGSLDPSFGYDTSGLALNGGFEQSDGHIVLYGNFTMYGNGDPGSNVFRLTASGTFDSSFGVTVKSLVSRGALLPDGSMLFLRTSSYYEYPPITTTSLLHVRADGTIDSGFASGAGFAAYTPNDMVVQPDGRIVIRGGFTSVYGQTFPGLARLNADGSLDRTFAPDSSLSLAASAQFFGGPAGDVYLIERFTGSSPARFVRLLTDAGGSARFANIATRGYATAGEQALIAGFVVTGSSPRRMLLRAVGPALGNYGVSGTLADPMLSLFQGTTQLASNDNWEQAGSAAVADLASKVGAFPLPAGARDSALVVTLQPGAYTAQAAPVGGAGSGGVALLEVYDGSDDGGAGGRAINISTRGRVSGGEQALIAGFVITGTASRQVLIRAIGPSLGSFGVSGALATPTLTVLSGSTVRASNTGWQSGQPDLIAGASRKVGAFQLPTSSRDSAILIRLEPGAYTAQVSGAAGETGVALVEVYEVPE